MPTLSSSRDEQTETFPSGFAVSHSIEFGLLAACLRAELHPKDQAPRDFIAQSVLPKLARWERVFELADHHGVMPAMHRVLCVEGKEQFRDALPPEVREELERRFARLATKNLRLAAELIHVLDCLEGAGVVAIPHKGPTLAEAVYGDLAMRDFSDLDVLVEARDVARAKQALATIRYEPNVALSATEERAYIASGYEYTFDGPAGKNLLEIQWSFVPRFFAVEFQMQAVFARAGKGMVAGRPVRVLAPEDLFLSMCVHAAKHLWGRLCWLRDIATFVEHVPVDWGRVQQAARTLGVERIVVVSLALARTLLRAEIPTALKLWAAGDGDPEVGKITAEIAQHIPHAEDYNTESVDYFRRMLRLRERRTDRWRFTTRLLFTPGLGEWAWIQLPESLFPLYHGVRMLRVGERLLGLRSKSAS
jgi:hypothetical protein